MFLGEWVYLSVTVVSVELRHLRGVNPQNRILYFTLVSRGNRLASASCFRIGEPLLRRDTAIRFPVSRWRRLAMKTSEARRALWKTIASPLSFRRIAVQLINYLAFQFTVWKFYLGTVISRAVFIRLIGIYAVKYAGRWTCLQNAITPLQWF